MKRAASKLFTGLGYLRIRHDEKLYFDAIFPMFAALFVLVADFAAHLQVFGPTGLLAMCQQFLAILPGLFVVALTAVATFDRPTMDEPMHGNPPTIKRVGGPEVLTRRRFLSYLFGYLSIVSLTLFFLGAIANQMYSNSSLSSENTFGYGLRLIFLLSYSLVFFNMLCTTLLGLHFLTERLHRLPPARIEDNDP